MWARGRRSSATSPPRNAPYLRCAGRRSCVGVPRGRRRRQHLRRHRVGAAAAAAAAPAAGVLVDRPRQHRAARQADRNYTTRYGSRRAPDDARAKRRRAPAPRAASRRCCCSALGATRTNRFVVLLEARGAAAQPHAGRLRATTSAGRSSTSRTANTRTTPPSRCPSSRAAVRILREISRESRGGALRRRQRAAPSAPSRPDPRRRRLEGRDRDERVGRHLGTRASRSRSTRRSTTSPAATATSRSSPRRPGRCSTAAGGDGRRGGRARDRRVAGFRRSAASSTRATTACSCAGARRRRPRRGRPPSRLLVAHRLAVDTLVANQRHLYCGGFARVLAAHARAALELAMALRENGTVCV